MRKGALAFLLFVCGHSQAGVNDVADFEKNKDGMEIVYYLHGVYAGFGVVNAEREYKGQPQLFCVPRKLKNTEVDLVRLVDNQIPIAQKSYKNGISDMTVEFILLDALERAFPCAG